MLKRRTLLKGLLAAPAIITTPGLLMPVKSLALSEPIWIRGVWDGDSAKTYFSTSPSNTRLEDIVWIDSSKVDFTRNDDFFHLGYQGMGACSGVNRHEKGEVLTNISWNNSFVTPQSYRSGRVLKI